MLCILGGQEERLLMKHQISIHWIHFKKFKIYTSRDEKQESRNQHRHILVGVTLDYSAN